MFFISGMCHYIVYFLGWNGRGVAAFIKREWFQIICYQDVVRSLIWRTDRPLQAWSYSFFSNWHVRNLLFRDNSPASVSKMAGSSASIVLRVNAYVYLVVLFKFSCDSLQHLIFITKITVYYRYKKPRAEYFHFAYSISFSLCYCWLLMQSICLPSL